MVCCTSVRPIFGTASVTAPASADFIKLRRLIRKVLNLSRPAHINHVLLKFLTNLDRRSGEDGPKAARRFGEPSPSRGSRTEYAIGGIGQMPPDHQSGAFGGIGGILDR